LGLVPPCPVSRRRPPKLSDFMCSVSVGFISTLQNNPYISRLYSGSST
jgi:hypothetical protein